MARIEGIVAAGALFTEMVFGAGCVPAEVPPVVWSGDMSITPRSMRVTVDAVDPRSHRGEEIVVRLGRLTSVQFRRVRPGRSGGTVRDFIGSAGCEVVYVNENDSDLYCWRT